MGIGTVAIVGAATIVAGMADAVLGLRNRDDLRNILNVLVKYALIGIAIWLFWDMAWMIINDWGGIPRI